MRFLVLGASGGCGSWLVQLAHERGHDITAVVRQGSPYRPPSGVMMKVGEVTDAAFVASVVHGHDAVLSCIGLRRAGVSLFARLLSPPDLVQVVMRNVRRALSEDEDARVIWISAGGVAESRAQATRPIRWMIRTGSVGVAYEGLEVAESETPPASQKWLAVRPVTLLNGAPKGKARPVSRYGLFSTIRRADVAQWILDVADGTRTYDGHTVLLGTAR